MLKNNIKIYRAKFKMTQAELARLIGVSRQTINAVEADKYVPSTVLALRMAAVFKCKVEDIFTLRSEA